MSLKLKQFCFSILLLLIVALVPGQAHALAVDTSCTAPDPIAQLLVKQGLKVDGPVCQTGSRLVSNATELGVLQGGDQASYEVPMDIDRVLVQSKLLRGDATDVTLRVESTALTTTYAFQDNLYLSGVPGARFTLSFHSDQPLEAQLSVVPVYLAWGPTYNLVTEAQLPESLPQTQLISPLILIGHPEIAGDLGLDYALEALPEREGKPISNSNPRTIADIVQGGTIDRVLVGDFDAKLVVDEDITLVALMSFIAEDGSMQRAIVFSPDVFRLDAEAANVVFSELRASFETGLAGLPSIAALNPAQATWMNTLLVLLKNAAIPLLLLLTVAAVGLCGPLAIQQFSEKRGLRNYFVPAKRFKMRLLQVTFFWLATLGLMLVSFAQAILQAENSKGLLRIWLDRLKGVEVGGGEFCRKCVLIEQTPWLLSVVVLALSVSLVWLLWPRLVATARWVVERIRHQTKSERPLNARWATALLLAFVLVLLLPLFEVKASLIGTASGTILLAYALLWSLTRAPGNKLVLWGMIALLGLLPVLELYRGVVQYYQPFVKAVTAEIYYSDATGEHLIVPAANVTVDPARALTLLAKTESRINPSGTSLDFEVVGEARLAVASETLWPRDSLIRVNTELAKFTRQAQIASKVPFVRQANELEYGSIQETIASQPTHSEIAILTRISEPWESAAPDYFNFRAFLAPPETASSQADSVVHSLGLIGSEVIVGYTMLERPGKMTVSKRDFNQVLGADVALVSVVDPTGKTVAFSSLDDDGEMLGRVGQLQAFELTIPEVDFAPGVYEINISTLDASNAADYVIESLEIESAQLVFRGPVTIADGTPFFLRPLESVNAMPVAPTPTSTAPYCMENVLGNSCFVSVKTPFHIGRIGELQRLKSAGANIQLSDEFILTAFSRESYFSPFRYEFRRTVDSHTALAIADARLSLSKLDTGRYQVRIEANDESRTNLTGTHALSIADMTLVGRYPTLTAITLVWSK